MLGGKNSLHETLYEAAGNRVCGSVLYDTYESIMQSNCQERNKRSLLSFFGFVAYSANPDAGQDFFARDQVQVLLTLLVGELDDRKLTC